MMPKYLNATGMLFDLAVVLMLPLVCVAANKGCHYSVNLTEQIIELACNRTWQRQINRSEKWISEREWECEPIRKICGLTGKINLSPCEWICLGANDGMVLDEAELCPLLHDSPNDSQTKHSDSFCDKITSCDDFCTDREVDFRNLRRQLVAPPPWFQTVLWAVCYVAFFGNLAVSLTVAKVYWCDRKASGLTRCLNLLFLSLSTADCLNGVYLFGVRFYWELLDFNADFDHLVQAIDVCKVSGVIFTLSSEAGIFIMAIMSSLWLHVVFRHPAKKPNAKIVMLSCACAWLLALYLALLPLQYDFSGRVLSHVSSHRLYFAAESTMKLKLAERAAQLAKCANMGRSEAEQFIAAVLPDRTLSCNLGYYGTTSVCLPNLAASSDTGQQQYAAAILAVNFLLLSYAAASCLLAYKSLLTQRRHPNARMLRRSSLMTLVRLCCWAPVSCICLPAVGGAFRLSSEDYALLAGSLLPLSSAANALVHSTLLDKFACCQEKALSPDGIQEENAGDAIDLRLALPDAVEEMEAMHVEILSTAV